MSSKKRDKSIALAVISDGHVNSTVALCPPIFHYDDGGTYRPSRGQVALRESFYDFCNSFDKVKAGEKIVVMNGDLGELGGGNGKSWQMVSRNPASIMRACDDMYEPIVDIADKVYVVRGTPFHSGQSSWIEEMYARNIDNVVPFSVSDEIDEETGKPKKIVASHWHLQKTCAGVKFDIKHQGSMGSLPWTQKHAALKLVERNLWHYMIDKKIDPPDVLIRSHQHKYAADFENYPTAGIFTPCWSLITEYAYHRNMENDTATIGGIWFKCSEGKYEYKKLIYEPKDEREIWVVDTEL